MHLPFKVLSAVCHQMILNCVSDILRLSCSLLCGAGINMCDLCRSRVNVEFLGRK